MIISYVGFLDLIWFLTNSKIKLSIFGRPQIFAASIIDQGHLSEKLEAKSTTQLDTQLYTWLELYLTKYALAASWPILSSVLLYVGL